MYQRVVFLNFVNTTRRRTDIKDVGESTLVVGEQTVGETTRRRNDQIPIEALRYKTT